MSETNYKSDENTEVSSNMDFTGKILNNYAVTIINNTHPGNKDGTVSEEIVIKILNNFGTIIDNHWELNQCCQLHCHAYVQSKKNMYLKKIIEKNKKRYPQYNIFVDILKTENDVKRWSLYIKKHASHDMIKLYYRLCKYYNIHSSIEDFDELANLDVEYNSKTAHFRYIDSAKLRFNDTIQKLRLNEINCDFID